MFVLNPQSLLLVVPRNVVTAVGLPLAAGFYSGSHTREVVRGAWYNVRSGPLAVHPWSSRVSHSESS